MIERDKVACIVGEISSASCLTIAQVAQRTKNLFVNTGGNSDALRGSNCNSYMFHVESQNSMYVKTCGRSLLARAWSRARSGSRSPPTTPSATTCCASPSCSWKPTAASSRPTSWCRPMPPTSRALLLEIRNAKPDLVISNLAGNQITNFLKQYSEFGLTFPVAGFGFDTAVAWAAGKGNFSGTWPLVWHHLIDTPGSQEVRRRLHRRSTASRRRTRPGATTTRSRSSPQAMQEIEVDRGAEDHRALGEGRQVRRDEDARRLLPRRRPPDDARDVHGDRRCRRRRSGTSGTSSPPRAPVPAPTSRWRRSRRRPKRTAASSRPERVARARQATCARASMARRMTTTLFIQQLPNGLLDGVYYLLIALGPVADLLARRHRQPRARRVLRHRRLPRRSCCCRYLGFRRRRSWSRRCWWRCSAS